jgi:hypothetical protein
MATPSFDPFEALGVARDASPSQIRAAYRELVGRYHPDKHRGNPLEELASEKLRDINRAYEILSDDGLRAAYVNERAQREPAGPRTDRSRPSTAPIAPPVNQLMKALRSFGLLATLLVFIKFGVSLSRELFLLLRGVLGAIGWLVRLSPVVAIAFMMAAGMGLSYFLRSRKGS